MTKPVSDARIVAATFRTVSDADAFDDMMDAWGRRLQEQLNEGGLHDLRGEMREHVREALTQFRKNEATPESNPVDDAIAVAAPVIVLTPDGVVIAANSTGAVTFGALQGRSIGTDWLEPRSMDDYETLLLSARRQTNRKQAILRTVDANGEIRLAEAVVLRAPAENTDILSVRSIDVEWSDLVCEILREAFELTEAECEVAELLFKARDSAAIARHRKTSIHTVRTQLRSIQQKTGVSSQTDLVRLLTLLAHTRIEDRSDKTTGWRDPWGNEGIIDAPDGMRIGYSWTGDPQGRDVLIVHNVMHGYAFPEDVERRLANAGIRLTAIQRPGFGNSVAPTYSRKTYLDALQTLIESLELRDVVAVQLSGVLGIVRSAIRNPQLYKSILLPGMGSPYTPEVRAMMPKSVLAIVLACRRAPLLGRFMIEAAIRNGRRRGIEWLGGRLFATGQADLACLADPAMRPSIRNALELTVGADPDALLWMYQTHLEDYDLELEKLTVPTHALVGTDVTYYHPPSIEAFAQLSDSFTWEPVEGAGLKMLYQRPDLIADHIIRAVES